MNNQSSANKKIIGTVIISVVAVLALFLFIFGIINGTIPEFLNNLWQIVAPITTGFVIAYLSNRIVTFFEKKVFKWISNFKVRRFISILITFICILLFISLILVILIPSLINTLASFWNTYIVNYEDAIKGWVNSLNDTMSRFSFLNSVKRLNPESVISWIKSTLPWIDDVAEGDIMSILPNVSDSITHNISVILEFGLFFGTSVVAFIKNFVLGIFIAFYMLMAKEKCKAYIRRLLNSFLSPKNVRSVVRFGKLVDRSFGGFIEGQLLDAIVVGIISFIVFLIFGIPVPHLLATIIAVTNVIPIFGPFIGGIPAAFIVLLAAPEKTILFVLLLFVIQQIDGNIICPHIIGDKINISSLATIIAIITMGGLYGILGMIIGVPIFAVVIHIINTYTMNALRKKGLKTSLKDYYVGSPDKIESTKSNKKKDNQNNNNDKEEK